MKLNRLIFERLDHRILVGTVSFLAIMVLVGWIWINENARMAAFESQYLARSIERGAELFGSSCSTCHGIDGRGALGVAPGLNNPDIFGHNFLAEIDTQVDALNLERTEVEAQGNTDRVTEIDAELATLQTQRDSLITQMQPAVALGYNPESPSRLVNLGWGSTLHNFIYSTIASGRPVSESYWSQPMPAWAQANGGSLRPDQLEDLTNFILNWDQGDDWTIEELNSVRQFAIYPINPATVSAGPQEPPVGATTTIADIMVGLQDVTGDPQSGDQLYHGVAFGCSGCHINAVVAPLVDGTWTRVETERLLDPQFAGYTGEQYLAESIIHPGAFTAPGYAPGLMPTTFGDRMSYQQLADIVAYLKTQDQVE